MSEDQIRALFVEQQERMERHVKNMLDDAGARTVRVYGQLRAVDLAAKVQAVIRAIVQPIVPAAVARGVR